VSSTEDSRGSDCVQIYAQSRYASLPAVPEYGVFLTTNPIGISLALAQGHSLKKGTQLKRGTQNYWLTSPGDAGDGHRVAGPSSTAASVCSDEGEFHGYDPKS